MLTPNRDPAWRDPGSRGMPAFESATALTRHNNPSYNVFPNLITPLDATGVPFLLFWPTGEYRMEIEVIWFAPREEQPALEAQWARRIENFERIMQEDIELLEHIQGSVDSPAFDGIMPNYQERRIYHWHEELDRRIGLEQVPDAHRVCPVLGPWISRQG
jgi:phenylpropionate dioxygenase-like ring-hydroxylating dioxygenase large terminal subunit